MIVYVLSDYASATERYNNGDVIEVSPEKFESLIADSPGSFSDRKPKPISEAPPKDKRMRARKVIKK